MEFGERTRDSSLGHTGKERPHLAMTGRLVGFLKVQCLVGLSHEIGRGAICSLSLDKANAWPLRSLEKPEETSVLFLDACTY